MSSNDNISSYYVKLREMSFDTRDIGPQVSALDLGKLRGPELVRLLQKVAAIDTTKLGEANPHLLVYGTRGNYTVKPAPGNVRLQPIGQANVAWIHMNPDEVPGWLDQPDHVIQVGSISLIDQAASTKGFLSIGIFGVSLCILGLSLYFTFRSNPLINDNAFKPIASQVQLTRLQEQVVGRYVNAGNNTFLIVDAAGKLKCVEVSATGVTQDETPDTYDLANMTGHGPVLRAFRLGVIFISNTDTLVFNGEDFVRKPQQG
ncbi:MAG: hypothetical protein K9M98_06745 [Cephaloticoccus sp.]|nr:hypothetical protein [Cephaloticoccus sp.]MCF7760186.1 hypothetical protein [Cephaloticoccus sp.]